MKQVRMAMAGQINASRNYSTEPEEEGLVMFGGPVTAGKDAVPNYSAECCNCVFPFGMHHSETNQCPVPPGPVSEGADPWEKDRRFKPVVSAARTDEGLISIREAVQAQLGVIAETGAANMEAQVNAEIVAAEARIDAAEEQREEQAMHEAIVGTEKRRPYCPHCGSADVGCEGTMTWSDVANDWEVYHAHDEEDCYCRACEKDEFVADWLTLEERAQMEYPEEEEQP